MVTIKEHTDHIIRNAWQTEPRNPYFNLVLSIIEKECGHHFILDNPLLMSVAEHYAVFNHFKTFSNVFTIAANPNLSDNTHLIVMADSLIPMDNADYPRGVVINQHDGSLEHYPLFSKKYRKGFPLALQYNGIIPKLIEKDYGVFDQNIVISQINKIIETGNNLFSIISNINNVLYERALANIHKPHLHYVSLERVATQLLVSLLESGDEMCNEFILSNFERTYNSLYGVRTCWGENHGSFLFWHHHNGILYPCKLVENCIESSFKKFSLSKQSLIDYLNSSILVPGGFVSLLMTTILPNWVTIGGHPQYGFLQRMIDYVNQYSKIGVDNRINNYNWGVHPEIGHCLNLHVHDCSTIYLAANPLSEDDISLYINKNKIELC